MPAHSNPLAQFVVTVWRDGEVVDSQVARDAVRALAIAFTMLTALSPLQGGDKLDIVEAPPLPDIPETSRSSHYSG